ncbi:hypothetical protein pipiens_004689 [Culex pipiens pipiens]|uniref:OTU domain-containing protein n=1 Tax=Culex pipiens pipiens TaxID=38569 RepID=A0ABD1CG37_CULPP
MVVRYIRRHADEMRHIILMEIAAGRRDQDGNPFLGTDDEKFEGLLEDLGEDHTWASTESIMAIQGLYGGTVKVLNPHYAPVVIGEGSGPVIEIHYNGINHYSSVLKEDETSTRKDRQQLIQANVEGGSSGPGAALEQKLSQQGKGSKQWEGGVEKEERSEVVVANRAEGGSDRKQGIGRGQWNPAGGDEKGMGGGLSLGDGLQSEDDDDRMVLDMETSNGKGP